MSEIFVDVSLSTEQEHPVSYSCCIGQGLCCVRERNSGIWDRRQSDYVILVLPPAACRLSFRSAVTILITFHFLRSFFLSLPLSSYFLFC